MNEIPEKVNRIHRSGARNPEKVNEIPKKVNIIPRSAAKNPEKINKFPVSEAKNIKYVLSVFGI